MQLPMHFEPFDPLPAGVAHYVPVLQARRGERLALAQLPDRQWSRVTPVICIVGPKGFPDEMAESTVAGWARSLSEGVGKHAFYLDMVRLNPWTPTTVRGNPSTILEHLLDRCRRRSMQFVPVYRERWQNVVTARTVLEAHQADGRGAALRVDVAADLASSQSLVDRTEAALSLLGLEGDTTDLIIDLGYLNVDFDVDVDGVAALVLNMVTAARWRNTVLTATSMPKAFSKDVVSPGAVAALPRLEWELYAALREALPERKLIFGDFGIQHPEPPRDQGGPGMIANIRYTTGAGTLVARGQQAVMRVGNAEYPELCRRLAEHPSFAGSEFSWGDQVILECGTSLRPAEGQTLWRAVGASHHVGHVLGELA